MRKHAQLAALVTAAMLLPNAAMAESLLVEGVEYTTESAPVEYVVVEPVFVDEAATTYAEESVAYPIAQDVTVVIDDSYTVQYGASEPTYIEPAAEEVYATMTTTEVIDGVVYETVIDADTPVIEGNSISQTY